MTIRAKEGLISVREAAQQCGRNMETVRRWIWGGKLPARKLGNQLFIKRGDLITYCRETAVKPYDVEEKEDFLEEVRTFRKILRARGYPEVDSAEMVRKSREGRMKEIEESLHKTAPRIEPRSRADLIKKMGRLRES